MRKLTIFTLVGSVLFTLPSYATDAPQPSPLTLSEVIQTAERSFPLFKAAELEEVIARADLLSAEGGFDLSWKTRGAVTPVGYYESLRVESMVEKPTSLWGSTWFAGYRLGSGSFPVYDEKQETLEYGEVRAGVTVPIWRNGPTDRRRANLAKSAAGTEVARLSVQDQRRELRRSAAYRYWTWVAAGQRFRVTEALIANVVQRDAVLRARVQAGEIPPFEQADNARAVEQRKAQLAHARRLVEQASFEVGLVLRNERGEPRTPTLSELPARFPDLPETQVELSESDFATAVRSRPEPQRIAQQARQNEMELNFAKNQLAPAIDVQVAGSQDFGAANPDRPDLSDPVLEVTLLVEIPLQMRLTKGRVAALKATASRLHHQKQYAYERILADVRDAHSAVQNSRERIVAAQKEVEIARALEAGERTRFEEGDSHLLFVNIREQQTAEAEMRAIDALLDYQRALADLEAARGAGTLARDGSPTETRGS